MGTVVIIIVIVVALLVVAGAAYLYQRRRSDQLQQRFGPEYERAVEESGDRRAGERDLREREHRRAKLDVQPLSDESATRYRAEWNALQQGFVDKPGTSVAEADRLVLRIMREEGYPVDEFDQRVNDISVDHPEVVTHYRDAHQVAVAQMRGETDTEQLRQAVTAYRVLVDVLLMDRDEPDGRTHSEPTNDTRDRS
jgi:hypothetical protein